MAMFNRFTLSLYVLLHCFNSVEPKCFCTDECKKVEDTPYEVILYSKDGQTASSEMEQLSVGRLWVQSAAGKNHKYVFLTICVDVKFDGHGSVPKTTIRIPTDNIRQAELYFSYADNNQLTVGYHTYSAVHSVNIKNGTYHTICVDLKQTSIFAGIVSQIITIVDGKIIKAKQQKGTKSGEENILENLKLAIDEDENTDVHVHLTNLRFYNSTMQNEDKADQIKIANDTVCNELSEEMLKWNERKHWCMSGEFNIVKHPCEKRCPNCN